MIRGIIFFLALWAFVTGGIGFWRQLNGKEKWSLVKTCAYGALTATIALVVLLVIVFLF
mgnify:CR=1 FL=1